MPQIPIDLAFLLEKAAVTNLVSSEEFPGDTKAITILMKYENLMSSRTDRVINEHVSPIQSASDLQQAIAVYDMDYLLAQNLSYSGLSSLANALILRCYDLKTEVPVDWQKVADLDLDWDAEYRSLQLSGD